MRFRGRLSTRALETLTRTLDADEGFRTRVADGATEDLVGRAGWLFLHRPDGWEEELALLAAAESDRLARDRTEADERSAVRRAAQLEQAAHELRSRVAAATEGAARAERELEAERVRRRAAEGTVGDLQRRLDSAADERDRAVADLAAARREADERLARVRSLESALAELTAARDRWAAPVEEAVADARAALGEAVAALDAASARLQPPAVDGARGPGGAGAGGAGRGALPDGPDGGGARSSRGPRRARRTPVRLVRGAVDGTVEATDQLLRASGVQVVVDGYNVSMEGWPHLDARTQRERLLSLLTAAAARSGAEVHVVFDGDDDGRRPAVSSPLAVRVRYTPAEVEADDVVIAMARDLPADRPVVVVSSDRRVQDGARGAGANVVSASALLAWDRR
ncbi:NYN domain-containing protein [Dermatobacter hominis]|uniref:NYN domain-containing protein n=1 Tax=Dermatobacter hominis TaxID=2884263 RepID=UPI001D12405D|nr:NYN domain-containing protein [Dermatobacter hominis]UDY35936.1 NYN domain-containing protein [Dermatobacter hominis]